MSDRPNDPEDDDRRTRANLFAVIAVLLLAAGAYWLLKTLDEHRKLMDCIASGRRDCLERIEPAAGLPPSTP